MRYQKAAIRVSWLALLAAIPLGACTSTTPPMLEATIDSENANVLSATPSNGLRVIIVRDPLGPAVATIMNYQVGSDDEAITGGRSNADTGNNVTQCFFVMPSQYLDIALNLEASRAAGLLDSQSLWDEERGAIEQEVTRDNSDAGHRLYVRMLRLLMAGTPYANPGLGTLHSFGRQIDAPQLKDFYERWYHPNNATYVIAGDVDPAATLARIERAFGKIPAGKLPPRREVYLRSLKPAVFQNRSDARKAARCSGQMDSTRRFRAVGGGRPTRIARVACVARTTTVNLSYARRTLPTLGG